MGLAERFGREGWRVVMVARNAERLAAESETLKKQGIDAVPRACDFNDVVQLDALIREESENGGIDYLNYNAVGIGRVTLFDQPLDTIGPDLMAGLGGGMVAARAAIPAMKARGNGTIIFTGGELGVRPEHDYVARSIAKAGLRCLTEALSKDPELRSLRIGYINVDAHVSHPGIRPAGLELLDIMYELHHVPPNAFSWHYDFRRPFGPS
jgi:NAD(P)-dependent dehydrogenase (short-subunit alcohol dehydrogenase family)